MRRRSVLLAAVCALVGCGGAQKPPRAPNPEHLIYRDSVTTPPLGGPGSSSSVVLRESGLLVIDSSPPGKHDERQLAPDELRRVLDALHRSRAELFAPPPPEPAAMDVSGTCELWLDGQHRSFEYGGTRCNKLQSIIPQR